MLWLPFSPMTIKHFSMANLLSSFSFFDTELNAKRMNFLRHFFHKLAEYDLFSQPFLIAYVNKD